MKLEAMKRIWNLYRKAEGMSVISSAYHFCFWAVQNPLPERQSGWFLLRQQGISCCAWVSCLSGGVKFLMPLLSVMAWIMRKSTEIYPMSGFWKKKFIPTIKEAFWLNTKKKKSSGIGSLLIVVLVVVLISTFLNSSSNTKNKVENKYEQQCC